MKRDRLDVLFNLMSLALIVIAAIFVAFFFDDAAWGWLLAALLFVALAVLAIRMDRR
jgi:hypothetical protein